MKKRQIMTMQDADRIIDLATLSAVEAMEQIVKLPVTDALRSLWLMKIEQVGCDPLDAKTPLNFIEQLNQTFTYVASARAVKVLLGLHPELAPFTLNLGTTAGSDIESAKKGGLAAEVFAAASTRNNEKLKKDIKKVGSTTAQHKYVFFMCPDYAAGRMERLEANPAVQVWSVGAEI